MTTLSTVDGLPVVPPTVNEVAELVASAGGDGPLTDGSGPAGLLRVSDAAACAVMAGCGPELFALALAAIRLVVSDPPRTLGIADPFERTGPAPHHPATVIGAGQTRTLGLWSGYGALSAPSPRLGPGVGRAVSLFAQRHLPAHRDRAPVFGHPGWYSYSLAENPELTVPGVPHHEFDVACAALSGPRGLYLGGADGGVDRIALIIADGLLTPLAGRPPGPRAALIAVNPTTARDLTYAGVEDLPGAIARAAATLTGNGADVVRRLDLLACVAGGASQTWISVAIGPPGSGWTYALTTSGRSFS